eukprot:Skav225182  [mRNA]  locus=scaffold3930:2676:4070:+ [translate_table: standard]
MFTDGFIEMPHGHAPVVADEPFHAAWADQFHEGQLERLRERLHNIGGHVVHRALFDESFKELHEVVQLSRSHRAIRSAFTGLTRQWPFLQKLPSSFGDRSSVREPATPGKCESPSTYTKGDSDQLRRLGELGHGSSTRSTKEQAPQYERTMQETCMDKSPWALEKQLSHRSIHLIQLTAM